MTSPRAWLLPGGIAALGVGMALVCTGVRVGALFLPGVYLLGAGFLTLAAAGILDAVRPAADPA